VPRLILCAPSLSQLQSIGRMVKRRFSRRNRLRCHATRVGCVRIDARIVLSCFCNIWRILRAWETRQGWGDCVMQCKPRQGKQSRQGGPIGKIIIAIVCFKGSRVVRILYFT
jgi:hypothetical protein